MNRSFTSVTMGGHPISKGMCALLCLVVPLSLSAYEVDSDPTTATPGFAALPSLQQSLKDVSSFESTPAGSTLEVQTTPAGDQVVTLVSKKSAKTQATRQNLLKPAKISSSAISGSAATTGDSSSPAVETPSSGAGSAGGASASQAKVGEQVGTISSYNPSGSVGGSVGESNDSSGGLGSGAGSTAIDSAITSLGSNSKDLVDSIEAAGLNSGLKALQERRKKDPAAGVVSPLDSSPTMKIGFSNDTVPIFANPMTGRGGSGNPNANGEGDALKQDSSDNKDDKAKDGASEDQEKTKQAETEVRKIFDDPPVKINIDNYNKISNLIANAPDSAREFAKNFTLFKDTVKELEQNFGKNDNPGRHQKVLNFLNGDDKGFVAERAQPLPEPDALSQVGGAGQQPLPSPDGGALSRPSGPPVPFPTQDGH